MILGYRISPATIAVTFEDGIPHILSVDHPNFTEIGARLMAGDYEGLEALVSPGEGIKKFLDGKIEVRGGTTLFYKGEEVNLAIVPTILDHIKEGVDPTLLLLFLDRLMQNPSMRSRNQLWPFMEKNGVVLYNGTNPNFQGWLVLYKGVRADYMDQYSGKFLNTVGTTHSMDRSKVDDDPNSGCSQGFHAGDYAYVQSYGQRKMIVVVDPVHVVSVPADSSFTKLRCCEYTVIGEADAANFKDFENSTYEEDGDSLDEDEGADADDSYEILYENGDSDTVTADNIDDALAQADDALDVQAVSKLEG